jgi:hypothetical protein
MTQSAFQVGDRVRLVRNVEIDWVGELKSDITGVVIGGSEGFVDIAFSVRFDEPQAELHDSDNVLWVIRPEAGSYCTPADFEKVA